MNELVHRFVRFAAGPLLWVSFGIVFAAKLLVPLAGLGLATISSQIATVDAAQVISLTNQQRSSLGFGALTRDVKLDAAARAKLSDMAAQGYFAHITPDNRQPWDFILQAGYRYQIAGENLGKGFQDATALIQAWMGSPSHRANIMNPAYRNVGVAVGRAIIGGRESTVIVQLFASPLAGSVAPKPVARAAAPVPSAPAPRIQPVSTDTRIAGAELTEVTLATAQSGKHASNGASSMAGMYLAAIFTLLTGAFIFTGLRKQAVIAWAGHGFALALLVAVPSLALPVSYIF